MNKDKVSINTDMISEQQKLNTEKNGILFLLLQIIDLQPQFSHKLEFAAVQLLLAVAERHMLRKVKTAL